MGIIDIINEIYVPSYIGRDCLFGHDLRHGTFKVGTHVSRSTTYFFKLFGVHIDEYIKRKI